MRLTARLTPSAPRLSDEVQLELTLSTRASHPIAPLAIPSQLGDFRVLRSQVEPPRRRSNLLSQRVILWLEPLKPGVSQLEGVRWPLEDGLPADGGRETSWSCLRVRCPFKSARELARPRWTSSNRWRVLASRRRPARAESINVAGQRRRDRVAGGCGLPGPETAPQNSRSNDRNAGRRGPVPDPATGRQRPQLDSQVPGHGSVCDRPHVD